MQMLGASEPAARSEGDNTTTRCPECGGLNPPDADWCGQCHTRFNAPADTPEAPRAAEEVGAGTDEDFASWLDLVPEAHRSAAGDPPATHDDFDPLMDPFPADDFDPLTDALPTGPGGVRHAEPGVRSDGVSEPGESLETEVVKRRSGAFSIAGERISWTCSRCETDNSLEAHACKVCGTPFAEIVGPPPAPRIARDPNMAALVSLFFPGAGHGYLGLWGQAIARAALSTWVLAVAVFAIVARALPGALLIGVVFGLTATALWGITAHDAFREGSDRRDLVILKPRAFLYVTIFLLFVLFASLMMAGFSVTRAL